METKHFMHVVLTCFSIISCPPSLLDSCFVSVFFGYLLTQQSTCMLHPRGLFMHHLSVCTSVMAKVRITVALCGRGRWKAHSWLQSLPCFSSLPCKHWIGVQWG
jgi:hypothetical protein